MRRPLFGTDGVRGVANETLTVELAVALGRAAVSCLDDRDSRPLVLVGRDTRRSGPMLEDAFCAGVASAGGVARRLGVVPTPAVALLVPDAGAAAGAVISASHNPFPDNGIKLFGPDGYKLGDATEAEIERTLVGPFAAPIGADTGWSETGDAGALDTYLAHLERLAGSDLSELHVVFDCANGAASAIVPRLVEELSLRATIIHSEPDGCNINVRCGSTHLDSIAETVSVLGADLGLAFDGDADRVLAVDETGSPIDGDHLLAILARDMQERGVLAGDAVVLTSMANLGLRRALEDLGIVTTITDVGDRHVLAAMRAGGGVLGGEQSGHVIALDHGTTGDGIQTAVLLLDAIARGGESLREAGSIVTKYPQQLVSIRADRSGLADAAPLWDAVAEVEEELGRDGRVVLRASGTEQLVRVMVEALDSDACDRHAKRLVGLVEQLLPVR